MVSWGGGGGGEGCVTFHGLSSHQYSNPLLFDQLEHVNSIQQLYKQKKSALMTQYIKITR